ncbi:MAG: methyltransferase domain-containing protein [Woeseiaceae bacterium]
MKDASSSINTRHMCRRFDRASQSFESADFVHRQAFAGLMDRMSPLVISPRSILDLGAGTGRSSRALAKAYPRSRVMALDLSAGMLHVARKKRSFLSRTAEVRGDAGELPFQAGSFDMVCANLLLPWIDDLAGCLGEVARVLKKGGVFTFATLGPDSFAEVRRAWSLTEPDVAVRTFPDMHDVGDALLRSGLSDPVLDVELLTVRYREKAALYRDLDACAARNCLSQRRTTLTGKSRLSRAENALFADTNDGSLQLTLELVFGHAWGTGPRAAEGEFRFDPADITMRRNR